MTINSMQDLVRVLDEHPEWAEALRVRLLTRELLELPQRLADFVAASNKRFEAIEARLDRVDDDLSTLKAGQAQMQEDLSLLKGGHARNAAERQAVLIAEDLGLEYVRTLTFDDVSVMVRSHDTTDIPVHDLRSFRLADLIMEATDAGESCYVAVEISFTANGRDTKRMLRNAGFLTRFTGRRAYAVIASVKVDDRNCGILDDGEVSWYRLERKTLDVA